MYNLFINIPRSKQITNYTTKYQHLEQVTRKSKVSYLMHFPMVDIFLNSAEYVHYMKVSLTNGNIKINVFILNEVNQK